MDFLPLNRQDLQKRGWESCDFIFVSGDAYVDHSAFAGALLCRVLEDQGYRVGMIPQPAWEEHASFQALGRPRLAFLVGTGNMDSMVAHYTAAKKRRSSDAYSPGGVAGLRPDRALIRYVVGIRSAYSQVPVIIGGIEAALRSLAHYDYWSDTIRRSVLLDSKADILVYGMGERPLLEIARRLSAGEAIRDIADVPGTCVQATGMEPPLASGAVRLPDYEALKDRSPGANRLFAEHFMLLRGNSDPASAKTLVEKYDGNRWVIRNPPALPLTTQELDHIYELPFTRRAHPQYQEAGGVPALAEVSFSLVSSRGCFGGCSFCAITQIQGRALSCRSRESLVREATALASRSDFKGYIHDVGGPTANFYTPPCDRQKAGSFCPDRECLFPQPCPQLKADHRGYLDVLAALRSIAGVNRVFIRSGIRYDYIEMDALWGRTFLEELCAHHVSGQLKVAPEHCSPGVLYAMGKNTGASYERFKQQFTEISRKLGLKQYLLPYFISAHPGSTLTDAVALALFLKKTRFVPEQAQDFYPTPGTMSTVMYATGLDPRTMEPIAVSRGEREKRLQRALLQFNSPTQRKLVMEALREAGREDLAHSGAGGLL